MRADEPLRPIAASQQAPDFERAPERLEEVDALLDANGEKGAPDHSAERSEEGGEMSAPAHEGPAGGGQQKPK